MVLFLRLRFGTARRYNVCSSKDWGKVSRGNDKFLSWMVGGPIAVARRGGQTLTLQEMTMFFSINDMIVVGSNYWNMVFAGPEGTALDDEEGIDTIKLFGENVAKLILKLWCGFMKIAVASSNGKDVDLHLGKASSLYIYNDMMMKN